MIDPQAKAILANCPFCGNDENVIVTAKIENDDLFVYFVQCLSCCARSPFKKDENSAISEWTRLSDLAREVNENGK